MTWDRSIFISFTRTDLGNVRFGDNSKGKILRIGNIQLTPLLVVRDVYYVKGLKHNLMSISQLCDLGHKVCFEASKCSVFDLNGIDILFVGNRKSNVYKVSNKHLTLKSETCLISQVENVSLWHRRFGHANLKLMSKLSKQKLVSGLLELHFQKEHICAACQLGKQTRSSFKNKKELSTKKPLELLHMDFFWTYVNFEYWWKTIWICYS